MPHIHSNRLVGALEDALQTASARQLEVVTGERLRVFTDTANWFRRELRRAVRESAAAVRQHRQAIGAMMRSILARDRRARSRCGRRYQFPGVGQALRSVSRRGSRLQASDNLSASLRG